MDKTDRPISPVSIFSCIENGSFRQAAGTPLCSIFRASLAHKKLLFRFMIEPVFRQDHNFEKLKILCQCVWSNFCWNYLSFRKYFDCGKISYQESNFNTKLHLYMCSNKSVLVISEFSLFLAIQAFIPNLDFSGEFCQIMIADCAGMPEGHKKS